MNRKVSSLIILGLFAVTTLGAGEQVYAQPPHVSYQGELVVSGTPFDGTAEFKFAIVSGSTNLWSNDGTGSGEPAKEISIQVSNGIFSVRLGDTSIPGMTTPIVPSQLANAANPMIRTWVDTGSGFKQLSDVPLSSSPFAIHADNAERALNNFDVTGNLQVFTPTGKRTLFFDPMEVATGSVMYIKDIDSQGNPRNAIELDSREGAAGAVIRMFNGVEGGAFPNEPAVEITANEGDGSGKITLFDNVGNVGIELDAKGGDGFSRIVSDVLEIRGGMDLAEKFVIEGGAETIRPGMVMSIALDASGGLVPSSEAYDRRVAGVVSGAGGVNTGMILGQEGSPLNGEHAVALSGRVYCWSDASYGAIEPGDLLTTSPTTGYAMKVTEYDRAQGAILGKAMTSLDEGTGLVLVLVSLQ